MNNENNQEKFKKDMKNIADKVGGVNFLLSLIEEIRSTKPNPLSSNRCMIKSKELSLSWNKIIFKDKVEILENILFKKGKDNNILNIDNEKHKKKIINMSKTLFPVEFKIISKGDEIYFKIFDTIEKDKIVFNQVFVAIFFRGVAFSKNTLKS